MYDRKRHTYVTKRGDVDVSLVVSNAVWTCGQTPAFRRDILPPSSGLKNIGNPEKSDNSELPFFRRRNLFFVFEYSKLKNQKL
jgi:hypothetical protein